MSLWLIFVGILLAGVSGLRSEESAVAAGPTQPDPVGTMFFPQDPPKTVPRLLEGADPAKASIYVSLQRQRAYLSIGDEVAIDTPVSTGKSRAMTPEGEYTVREKKTSHASPVFGEFLGEEGHVVRTAVSARTDVAPSGTSFRPVPVQHYLRLDESGLAIHAGPVPGYPAADRTVWLPGDVAALFFQRVQVGTPVKIGD